MLYELHYEFTFDLVHSVSETNSFTFENSFATSDQRLLESSTYDLSAKFFQITYSPLQTSDPPNEYNI